MRGVVLGVFAAAVFVIVLDEIFKQSGVEVVFLREDALEAEFHQLVDDGAAEGIALGGIGDEFTHTVEQGDLRATVGLDGEDVVVADGDVAQGVVEQLGEFRRVLAVPQVGDEVLRFQARGVCAHLHLQHFQVVSAQVGDGLFPAFSLGQVWPDFLGFKRELVIEKLVEKDLGDDLEFVAVVAKAIGSADTLEAVDELAGAFFKILRDQVRAPVRVPVLEPAINSFMYSATTSWLMVREASGLSLIFWRLPNSSITSGIIIFSK